MYLEHQEGLLHTHAQKFAEAQFGELEDHPCSPAEDAFLTVGTCLLALAPILIVAFFAVF